MQRCMGHSVLSETESEAGRSRLRGMETEEVEVWKSCCEPRKKLTVEDSRCFTEGWLRSEAIDQEGLVSTWCDFFQP